MDLDFLHVDQLAAALLADEHAIAGGARLVRGGHADELRLILAYQRLIGREAARRHDDSFGQNGIGTAVLALDDDANGPCLYRLQSASAPCY